MNVDRFSQMMHPDQSWWDEPAMRSALARRDVGQIFMLLNRRHGMTQRRIAELAGFAASEVYEITRGRQVMAYDVLVRIAEGLGIPRALMGLGYGTESAYANHAEPLPLDEPGQRRQFIAALAGFAVGGSPDVEVWLPRSGEWPASVPEVVNPAAVATVREITQRHRELDAAYGGGSCRDSALGYLAWAQCLTRSRCQTPGIAAALYAGLADLHNLVGWMSHDLGKHMDARRHLAQGLVYAQKADSSTLMADAYYRLGRVSIHQGNSAEALHLFQLGQMVATNSNCLTSVAILHANIAWAHARMGNAPAMRDSLARARDEIGRADTTQAPQWTRFFCEPGDLEGMSGVVHSALARYSQYREQHAVLALNHASRALERRTETSRSGAFDHVTMAMGYALLGQQDKVAPHAQAVLDAAEHVRSRRLLDRLSDVADVIEPRRDRQLAEVVTAIRARVAA
ncbi:helix-turn-helix transcriptional regulator [Micromonospora sp. WMMD1082]|uniref:helix-turn-helix domain-containing protein n=1 Tax=Micromonospora sp. WMMD1082 TaxID=3016104 RepID=UPI00241738A5|nr:helix-turn-helix transcriptional regulator [Micromonospora sp. WMMD1082]MDG4796931.1 helix-turn-helix transcriptional regulator [Micromonospora sp. WMMD1082]